MEVQSAEALREKIRSLICDVVNAKGPISAVALVTEIIGQIAQGKHGVFDVPANNMADDFNDILEACVSEEGIVELEYVRQDTSYKISSLLFPMGTVFQSWRGPR